MISKYLDPHSTILNDFGTVTLPIFLACSGPKFYINFHMSVLRRCTYSMFRFLYGMKLFSSLVNRKIIQQIAVFTRTLRLKCLIHLSAVIVYMKFSLRMRDCYIVNSFDLPHSVLGKASNAVLFKGQS